MGAVCDPSEVHSRRSISQREDTHRDASKERLSEHLLQSQTFYACVATNTALTISWHQTQRRPAKVFIFLWQTWHLVELQSALIQSWEATWEQKDVAEGNLESFSFLKRWNKPYFAWSKQQWMTAWKIVRADVNRLKYSLWREAVEHVLFHYLETDVNHQKGIFISPSLQPSHTSLLLEETEEIRLCVREPLRAVWHCLCWCIIRSFNRCTLQTVLTLIRT